MGIPMPSSQAQCLMHVVSGEASRESRYLYFPPLIMYEICIISRQTQGSVTYRLRGSTPEPQTQVTYSMCTGTYANFRKVYASMSHGDGVGI